MKLLSQFNNNIKKKLALLIDPDKTSISKAKIIVKEAYSCGYSFVFVGGSLVSEPIDDFIKKLKSDCKLPIVLFPGSPFQLSKHADGLLFLSLISGRNPEYLIGQHVISAPIIKKYKINTLPTGYILVNSGTISSTEYISNTTAIPSNKIDLIKATAIAGEMLGLKLIYLENGSGSVNPINIETVKEVKKNISIPLIVGGGISTANQLTNILKAGADVAVIGTAIEKNFKMIREFAKCL